MKDFFGVTDGSVIDENGQTINCEIPITDSTTTTTTTAPDSTTTITTTKKCVGHCLKDKIDKIPKG